MSDYGLFFLAFVFLLLCLHTVSRRDWYESPKVLQATVWFVLSGLALGKWLGLSFGL